MEKIKLHTFFRNIEKVLVHEECEISNSDKEFEEFIEDGETFEDYVTWCKQNIIDTHEQHFVRAIVLTDDELQEFKTLINSL